MAEIAEMTRSALKSAAKARLGKKGGALSNPKGLAAAGLGMAVLPAAVEQIAKRIAPGASQKASELGDQAKEKLPENLGKNLGGLPESLKKLPENLMPGGDDDKPGGDDDSDSGRAAPGYGSGRRMPIQQAVNVAVPLKLAYNQWTQFEDWPEFMHRPENVEQVDDATVAISTKVWGIRRRFEAKIIEQKPDQRIEWNVEEGLSHTGVVTFHKLSDRLTRIEVTVDVEPHGLLEKAGRGMRFAKRAIRGDLHRFKAFVELNDEAEGGWRGTIEDGDVKRRTERKSSRSSSRGSSGGGRSRNGGRSRARSRG